MEIKTPYDNGCIKQLEWDDGTKTGTSGCGEDGIYCDICQAKREGYIKAKTEVLEIIDKIEEEQLHNCEEDEYGERAKAIEVLEELKSQIQSQEIKVNPSSVTKSDTSSRLTSANDTKTLDVLRDFAEKMKKNKYEEGFLMYIWTNYFEHTKEDIFNDMIKDFEKHNNTEIDKLLEEYKSKAVKEKK